MSRSHVVIIDVASRTIELEYPFLDADIEIDPSAAVLGPMTNTP